MVSALRVLARTRSLYGAAGELDSRCSYRRGDRMTSRTSSGLIFALFVFVLVIIVIVGISRPCRVSRDGDYLVDATCPLLLQTSLNLYGIYGHVVFLLTFGFGGWARSRSSPSASAQYISASFRYWRPCRSDFVMSVSRANSFAFARYVGRQHLSDRIR